MDQSTGVRSVRIAAGIPVRNRGSRAAEIHVNRSPDLVAVIQRLSRARSLSQIQSIVRTAARSLTALTARPSSCVTERSVTASMKTRSARCGRRSNSSRWSLTRLRSRSRTRRSTSNSRTRAPRRSAASQPLDAVPARSAAAGSNKNRSAAADAGLVVKRSSGLALTNQRLLTLDLAISMTGAVEEVKGLSARSHSTASRRSGASGTCSRSPPAAASSSSSASRLPRRRSPGRRCPALAPERFSGSTVARSCGVRA